MATGYTATLIGFFMEVEIGDLDPWMTLFLYTFKQVVCHFHDDSRECSIANIRLDSRNATSNLLDVCLIHFNQG